MEMVTKKSSYKGNFRNPPFISTSIATYVATKNIARLEINANELLISFVCSFLLINVKVNAAM